MCTTPIRSAIISAVVATAALVSPALASAQGFGVGGRFSWVTADSDADVDSVRFAGAHVRILSSRWGIELSRDTHSETSDELHTKVTETPTQVSLLLRLAGGGRVSPYLLGGKGWYKRKVELLDSDEPDVESNESGWHAGGGLELRAHRHFGIHGDYRYTFLDFGDDDDDDDDDEGIIGGLLPGHRGSMWTLGATIYF